MSASSSRQLTERAIRAEKARRSLAEFIRQSWEIVEPGTPLIWNWHIDAICEHLEAVTDGRIRRLLINIPPCFMNSLIVSFFWPAWMWARRPEWRALFASYASDLAVRDSVRCRDVITSEWFRESFHPDWTLKGDQNVKSFYENSRRGFRFSLSVGGRATGFRGDCVVVDDPLNAKEQHSEIKREECIFWWDKVMSSRLNDQRKGARVIIMQRLHEADLSGHVIARGGYDHLCLPTEFEPDRLDGKRDPIPRVTSIGWSDPRKKKGELLFPELFPETVLQETRKDLGGDYAGQHQQRPSPEEGGIFKKAWFDRRYTAAPLLREVWTCWDTAQKAKEQNDESACTVAGLGEDGDLYILRMAHGRWETPDLAKFLVEQARWARQKFGERYRGDYVEDKSSGTTLMQYLRRSNPELALIPIYVDAEREVRAHGVTPLCEGGRVVFPDLHANPTARDWVEFFLHQATTFPNGAHDDLLDTFIYSVKKLMGTLRTQKSRRRGGGVI